LIDKRKTIFPKAGIAKRLLTRAIRTYAKTLSSGPGFIEPSDSDSLKFLIHSMGGIGNTIMATPLMSALRKSFPRARIDLLTSPGAVAILKGFDGVSELIADSAESAQGLAQYIQLERRLLSSRYDAALLPLNAITIRLAARTTFARIPIRVCHRNSFRLEDDINGTYTNLVERRQGIHDVDCNLDLLKSLCGGGCEVGPMSIPISAHDIESAGEALQQAGFERGRVTIAFCPGSSGWMSFKRWPLPSFLELARRLLNEQPEWRIALFLGPDEIEEAERWTMPEFKKNAFVVKNMPMKQYAAALGTMSLVVANDSLPLHIASALQVPVVALFGPTNPHHTGPWGCRNRILLSGNTHSGYFELPYPLDPSQFPDVMADIPVDDVLQNVYSLIREVQDSIPQ
jgi:lipopolysaccharide heptosyltransferase II